MKPLWITIASFAGMAGVVTLAAIPQGDGWSQSHTERMRGKDAYYEVSESHGTVPPVNVRIQGEKEVWLQLGYTFTFRKGRELEEAAPLVEKRLPYLLDGLLTELPGWKHERLRTRAGKLELKRFLLSATQAHLFPGEEARVERIYVDPLLLQVVNVR